MGSGHRAKFCVTFFNVRPLIPEPSREISIGGDTFFVDFGPLGVKKGLNGPPEGFRAET